MPRRITLPQVGVRPQLEMLEDRLAAGNLLSCVSLIAPPLTSHAHTMTEQHASKVPGMNDPS